ncbi:MAG TPA: chromosome segregation ATPase [Coleofasciculaceae cyanobacterium]
MTRNREIPDGWPASGAQDSGGASPHTAVGSSPPLTGRRERIRRFTGGVQFWAILIVLFAGGVGFVSIALLLKLPAVPNCPATFWPTASASMRLYCAQVAANKQTAENLLEAIALVEGLPADHPLRPEINRSIEQWSLDILKIGDQKFQAGQLNEAIKIARKIPAGVSAYKLVEQRIDGWQAIWSKAQAIYDKVEQLLRKSNWNQAFAEAGQLTYVDNKYWATTKYEQLTKLIRLTREASAQLDKARDLSKSNLVDDLLAAIKEAQKISRQSYAYKQAQDLIAECANKLVKLAENRLEQLNWQGAIDIANKLPPILKLPQMKSDLINLAQAISSAESGTSADLEKAIASAQKLRSDRPLYKRAQQLIGRWQRETEDVARLERARMFASSGLTTDLKTAITEAEQIPSGNPRYQEARADIGRWTRQVETIEDQPYLDRANQIAAFGGLASLQEAVQEASRIAPGRALYKQAQEKIAQWTETMQRQQDQPYLDQARTLANGGDLSAAIAAAQQIKSGRALYREAQNEISGWQADLEGQQRLQEAYNAATPGTPEALSSAIRLARQVPSISKSKADARDMVSRWSSQLLTMAQDRSAYNIGEAIAIAKMIPSGTDAYEEAQTQIQSWQSALEPPPLVTPQVQSGTNTPYSPY